MPLLEIVSASFQKIGDVFDVKLVLFHSTVFSQQASDVNKSFCIHFK